MKFYNVKESELFNLGGSIALDEPGFNRFSKQDRDFIGLINPSVKILSKHSSGISVKFETNSRIITVNVLLDGPAYMSHMTAVAQCGLDLYVYDERKKQYIFHKSSLYDFKEKEFMFDLGVFETKKNRKIWINLPLYIGVEKIEVGLEDKAYVKPVLFSNNKKILFYGTSITQGATASRPGMSHTNLISRWLDAEIFNYGFSGSAFLEKEMAEIIAKMENPDLFIIDAQANAGVDDRMKNNLEEFINTYRKFHPNVPIIVATRIRFAVDLYNEEKIKMREFYDEWIEETVDRYRKTDKNIYLLKGENVFDKYFTEMTVDGIHPNDLGSMKMAEYYFEFFKNILNK